MIAYKFVIKRLGQYYPLINFGIDGGKIKNCPRYKLGETYNNCKDFNTNNDGIGYHFWTEPNPKWNGKYKTIKDWWEDYFLNLHKRKINITILKCDVFNYSPYFKRGKNIENRIIGTVFKVLEEINESN